MDDFDYDDNMATVLTIGLNRLEEVSTFFFE